MRSFIPATGRTQHVAGVCLNRIGKENSTRRFAHDAPQPSGESRMTISDFSGCECGGLPLRNWNGKTAVRSVTAYRCGGSFVRRHNSSQRKMDDGGRLSPDATRRPRRLFWTFFPESGSGRKPVGTLPTVSFGLLDGIAKPSRVELTNIEPGLNARVPR
jgi:hypothetical protein